MGSSGDQVDFSGVLKNIFLERLAEADEFEVIRQVQEIFLDYYVIHPNHISLDIRGIYGDQLNTWNLEALHRTAESLISLLLSLRKRPIIRYEGGSSMAAKLAHEVKAQIDRESDIFDFRPGDAAPILLILDRRTDLITPLVMPWTYQAMIHELFGLYHGRVSIPKEILKEGHGGADFVLTATQDPFFREHLDHNFGDLGEAVQSLVYSLQQRTIDQQSHLESLPAMRKFLQDYPDYRRHQTNVTKHVSIAGALSKQVEMGHLMQISEMEQLVACAPTYSDSLQGQISAFLLRKDISQSSRLRLALIFVLRFAKHSQFNFLNLIDILRRAGLGPDEISLIDFCTKVSLAEDYQAPKTTEAVAARLDLTGIRGKASNSLSGKYVPPIIDTVDQLSKGRLRADWYPFVDPVSAPQDVERAQEIIIFMVGGATYQEAHYLRMYQKQMPAVSIVFAGTSAPNGNK